jgi:uncharacterized protein (TIGR00369 family)
VILPVVNPALFAKAAHSFPLFPHCQALGLEFIHGERGKAVIRLPYAHHLQGNRQTGVIHGGVVTTLIDTTSGLAVFSLLNELEIVVTLDLRIDYLRPATPDMAIYCEAECYRLANQVAFVRASAYQDDDKQTIAQSMGTFMRKPFEEKG